MASAIFAVPIVNGTPQLNMTLIADDGTDGYGYSCIDQVPQENICLVRIWSSDVVLDALAADPAYQFIEDVVDGEAAPV